MIIQNSIGIIKNVQSENTQNIGYAGVSGYEESARLKFLVPRVESRLLHIIIGLPQYFQRLGY